MDEKVFICTPYITKNGKRIYPKNSKVFCFWVDKTKKSDEVETTKQTIL